LAAGEQARQRAAADREWARAPGWFTAQEGLDHLLDFWAPDQMVATLDPHQNGSTASIGQCLKGAYRCRTGQTGKPHAARRLTSSVAAAGRLGSDQLRQVHEAGGRVSGARLQPVRPGIVVEITGKGWAPRVAIARKGGFEGPSWGGLLYLIRNTTSAPSAPWGLGLADGPPPLRWCSCCQCQGDHMGPISDGALTVASSFDAAPAS